MRWLDSSKASLKRNFVQLLIRTKKKNRSKVYQWTFFSPLCLCNFKYGFVGWLFGELWVYQKKIIYSILTHTKVRSQKKFSNETNLSSKLFSFEIKQTRKSNRRSCVSGKQIEAPLRSSPHTVTTEHSLIRKIRLLAPSSFWKSRREEYFNRSCGVNLV